MLLIQDHRRAALTTSSSGFEQHEPSLLDIIRIAAVGLINSSDQSTFQLPPYSHDVTKKVRLVQYLLNAAEEVGRCNYDHAMSLLDLCNASSSKTGNLTQRLVYYFAQALCQRAKIPFYQVGQLAGVQAIVESVEKSKRIHIVDLNIRNGMQWAALMQALVTRSRRALVILKITAIVMTTCENLVNETGERLKELANSMNIPFSFKAVIVPNMLEIHEKQFDLDPREAVVIFSEYALHGILPNQNELEALMVVIRHIDPTVMVVVEKEANLNSLNFAQRFVEVLFHHGAYFDCIDTCFDSDDENKMVVESIFASAQVSGILGKEKEMKRSVTVDVWRKFFRRFWMVEASLSPTTMDTVDVLLSRFTGGSCCSVDMDGRSLVVGWKGVPIFSFSTWKFLGAKPRKRTSKSKQMNTCGPVN
ncbi:DELLA protein RGL2 [Linum grandiflorum]